MKANKSPEKIYLVIDPIWGSMSVNYNRNDTNNIEYIRKDAFIEKACNLLARMVWEVTYEDLEGNSIEHYDKVEFIEDFKNYMKGE